MKQEQLQESKPKIIFHKTVPKTSPKIIFHKTAPKIEPKKPPTLLKPIDNAWKHRKHRNRSYYGYPLWWDNTYYPIDEPVVYTADQNLTKQEPINYNIIPIMSFGSFGFSIIFIFMIFFLIK